VSVEEEGEEKKENKKDIQKDTLQPITKVNTKLDKELQEWEVDSTTSGGGGGEDYAPPQWDEFVFVLARTRSFFAVTTLLGSRSQKNTTRAVTQLKHSYALLQKSVERTNK
jgi:hypothetical protein